MIFAPLTPRALYEEVAERLRARIFSHDLTPGSWIDEQALAAEYGISRTPLREALKVLASEGLVTMKLRRGCYVTEVSLNELREIFEVLALLEGQAAFNTAQHISTDELLKLNQIHVQLEKAAKDHNVEAFFKHNQDFHQAILDIAANQRLISVVQDLRKVLKLSRHNSLLRTGRLQQSLKEHEQILLAIQTHEPETAREAMRLHLLAGQQAAVNK